MKALNPASRRHPARLPVVLLLALATASGCSVLPDTKRIDYKAAGRLPPLEVPPDLTQPGRDDRFVVGDAAGSATYSAYATGRGDTPAAAAGSDVLPNIDKARMERAGTQRWLVVNGTAEQVWPKLREFWQGMGFTLNVESPQTGVLETEWAENRAKLPQDIVRQTIGKIFDDLYSTSERDKFRTRIERGAQAGTVEIYISHRGMVELYVSEGKELTRWQPRPADPELEAEMLRRLMVRLGADEKRASAIVASAAGTERARILRDDKGVDRLAMDETFERAWRRVGLALDRSGFTVEDRDRAQGVYYVRYLDPEAEFKPKDEGWLAKLAFWRDKETAPPTGERYRILVKDGAAQSTVQVLTREGGEDKSDTARRILGLLHQQLK